MNGKGEGEESRGKGQGKKGERVWEMERVQAGQFCGITESDDFNPDC